MSFSRLRSRPPQRSWSWDSRRRHQPWSHLFQGNPRKPSLEIQSCSALSRVSVIINRYRRGTRQRLPQRCGEDRYFQLWASLVAFITKTGSWEHSCIYLEAWMLRVHKGLVNPCSIRKPWVYSSQGSGGAPAIGKSEVGELCLLLTLNYHGAMEILACLRMAKLMKCPAALQPQRVLLCTLL